ncbi:mpv17-like protein [Trichonephila inaurata madagascariensis]|uniref:Mpv17-like protein n=1 Tax=Trichonephila inaurata madagascariensis TaxID=2747483 RepID=A0A8X6IHD3_9ARAC|nr:mpv17-like protein [Trichonephila inaurata madagascariensis]
MSSSRILSKAKHMFQKHPLLMNMTCYGTIYISAEISQQTIKRITSADKTSIDWTSVGRFATIGIGGMAPVLYTWYKCLDYLLPAATGATVAAKVAADLFICSPTTINIFFVGMGALEGKEDVFAELKAKFWSTYKMSCCFWLPAQAINFALLPPYTRVAFVGVASFVWVNVLCFVKRREVRFLLR